MTTWREKQAAHPDPTAAALDVLGLDNTDANRTLVEDAIDAYDAAVELCRQCDEPGCERQATCGWVVPDGGYRRTCNEHIQP